MVTKEILVVTNYFPPEKGAAANRIYSLATSLAANGYKVEVVCPLPNYPGGSVFLGYRGKLYSREEVGGLRTHRLWIWPSNSQNKAVRLLSMLSFSVSLSLFFLFKRIPKKNFVQYSPVFIGFTGVFWGWLFRKKNILNVSDLWPLAGFEMGLLKKGGYYSVLERMERFCYRKATLIVGQSEEILAHIAALGIEKDTFLYRNIPQFEAPVISEKKRDEKITIVYAGLLGIAQGMYTICKALEIPEGITLHVYGAGPEAEDFRRMHTSQIVYHGEISREQLHKELQQYDIAFIPLVNRIYGSVPSKIFEYTRLGLPVLYYAGGEGETIVSESKLGWTVPAQDMVGLQNFIASLTVEKLKEFPKEEVQRNAINAFNFNKQFNLFLTEIDTI